MSKLIITACLALAACTFSSNSNNVSVAGKNANEPAAKTAVAGAPGNALPPPSVILARKEVPILCYHQIRDWKPTDSRSAKDYIMPIADFKAQMKMLHD